VQPSGGLLNYRFKAVAKGLLKAIFRGKILRSVLGKFALKKIKI